MSTSNFMSPSDVFSTELFDYLFLSTNILCFFIQDSEDEEREEDSPGEKLMTEVKGHTAGTSEQAIAQAIVFSLLQKQRHPNFRNHIIPNILISPDFFQIILYDAEHDISLCSNFIDLFNVNNEGRLSSEVVITLWLVLHYRLFCKGLVFEEPTEVEIFKSNFHELAKEKWNIYTNCLKKSVPGFPVVDNGICIDTWNRKVLQGTEYCKGMKKRKLHVNF